MQLKLPTVIGSKDSVSFHRKLADEASYETFNSKCIENLRSLEDWNCPYMNSAAHLLMRLRDNQHTQLKTPKAILEDLTTGFQNLSGLDWAAVDRDGECTVKI